MKKTQRVFISAFIAVNLLFMAACSTNAPVAKRQAGSLNTVSEVTVKKGTITAVKKVAILGTKGRAGSTVGSIAGSILGSSIPIAGSMIGSMIGSAVGSEADKQFSKRAGLEITLQIEGGEKVTVTQLAETSFKVGDKVQLIIQDNKARVAHLQSNN